MNDVDLPLSLEYMVEEPDEYILFHRKGVFCCNKIDMSITFYHIGQVDIKKVEEEKISYILIINDIIYGDDKSTTVSEKSNVPNKYKYNRKKRM